MFDLRLIKIINAFLFCVLLIVALLALLVTLLVLKPENPINSPSIAGTRIQKEVSPPKKPETWVAPDTNAISRDPQGDLIRYGRKLISNTSEYIGPNGKVKALTNGMNCQNCHLDAGTRPYGNNYSAVFSTYPKLRDRSGTVETIPKRINDCIERSLNGTALPEEGKEMKAIIAYMAWLGQGIPKGEKPKGVGLMEPEFLDRPANPEKGKPLYEQKCKTCHGQNGEGILNPTKTGWTYPPLWGNDSYNQGAGLLRLSRFAGYIKANMPLGATYDKPQLTNEECWHIAAYVNSMERPSKVFPKDWPDISKKPIDHPFGPYADGFDEKQHKYGPFQPIVEKRKAKKKS